MEKKESIQVIREQLKLGPEEAELERWRKDGRTGVRKLLEAYDRKQAARKLERERLERLQDLEREFWEYFDDHRGPRLACRLLCTRRLLHRARLHHVPLHA